MFGTAQLPNAGPASNRIEEQLGNILWAIEEATALELWDQLVQLREALDEFMYRRGFWQQAIRLGESALEAASALRNFTQMAWCCLYPLARVHYHKGDYAAAQRWSEQALALFQLLDNDHGIIAAQRYLGRVMQSRSNFGRARSLFEEGLERARRNPDNRDQQALMLATLAGLAQAQGNNPEAKTYYEAALETYAQRGVHESIAPPLHELGNLALADHNLDEAENWFNKALDVLRGSGWKNREAAVRYSLALLQEERGNLPGARDLLQGAQRTFLELSAYADLARVDSALNRVSAALSHQQQGKPTP